MFWAMILTLFTHLPDLGGGSGAAAQVGRLRRLPRGAAACCSQLGHEEIAVLMGYTLW